MVSVAELRQAIESKQPKKLETLLKTDASQINIKTVWDRTLLQRSIMEESTPVMARILVKYGHKINRCDFKMAVRYGRLETIKMFCSHGRRPIRVDLRIALMHGHHQMLRYLLPRRSSRSTYDKKWFNSLCYLCCNKVDSRPGDVAAVKFLLASGVLLPWVHGVNRVARVLLMSTQLGWTRLHSAIDYGDFTLVLDFLLGSDDRVENLDLIEGPISGVVQRLLTARRRGDVCVFLNPKLGTVPVAGPKRRASMRAILIAFRRICKVPSIIEKTWLPLEMQRLLLTFT